MTYNEDDTEVRADETRQLLAMLVDPVVVARPKGGHALMAVQRGPKDGERLVSFLEQHGRK